MQLVAPSALRFPALAAFVLRFAPLVGSRVPRAEPAAPPVTRQLRAGLTVWLERPLGTVVTCGRGVLWLTLDDQPQDLILEAGQTWHCASTARLAVHALEDADFRLGSPGESA